MNFTAIYWILGCMSAELPQGQMAYPVMLVKAKQISWSLSVTEIHSKIQWIRSSPMWHPATKFHGKCTVRITAPQSYLQLI